MSSKSRTQYVVELLAAARRFMPLLDAVCIVMAALLVAAFLNQLRASVYVDMTWPPYGVLLSLAFVLTPALFASYGVYQEHSESVLLVSVLRLFGAWVSVLATLVVLSVLTKTTYLYSRVFIGTWVFTAWVGLISLRFGAGLLRKFLRARGIGYQDVVLIGEGDLVAQVISRVHHDASCGIRLTGRIGFSKNASIDEQLNVPYIGNLGSIGEALARLERWPDQVWVTVPTARGRQFAMATQAAVATLIDTRVVLDITAQSLLLHPLNTKAGITFVNLSTTPQRGLGLWIKAVEDRVLALVALVLFLPVMMVVALGIKLDSPGPVLFKQKRHGWNGVDIEVWKFRSMYVQPPEQPWAVYRQAQKQDPRVTRFGAFLRRTSLDELPQFFNVLLGDMSMVGPRPHPLAMNEMYRHVVPGYMLRCKVKPGITGWAQVNGLRGETETFELIRQRIEYDLYYIRNWSIWLDVAILLLTPARGIFSSRAY